MYEKLKINQFENANVDFFKLIFIVSNGVCKKKNMKFNFYLIFY